MYKIKTPATRRSRRLQSEDPSPVQDTPAPSKPAHAPKHAQATVAATAFDPSTTIDALLRGENPRLPRLTKSELQVVAHALADRVRADQDKIYQLGQDVKLAESLREAQTMTRAQQQLKMQEIMRKHREKEERLAAEKAAAEAAAASADTETATPPPPRTPSTPADPTPTTAAPSSMWKSFTSLTKVFTTPFSRKRPAEEEPESSQPTQKRQKPEERTPAPAAIEQALTTPAPAAIEPPATAPARAVTLAAHAANTLTTTPAPKRKRTAATTTTATNTPLPAIPESFSPKPSTAVTPRPRTLATVRAAKSANAAKLAKQQTRRYAWEPSPQVKEKNADTRIAKIRRAEALRRELAEIERDEELARKSKRVKVDHLAVIPHNLPGDPSGTFRVPEIDSDDEIEVEEYVEVRSNIFDTPTPAASSQAPNPPLQVTAPTPPAVATPRAPRALPPSSTPAIEAQKPAKQVPSFVFPSVGPKPATYAVTDVYREVCRANFAAGLAAF